MAEPTIKDVLDRLAELKGDLETATVRVKNVEMERMTEKERKEADEKKKKEEEELRKEGKPVPEDPMVTVSKFKASLIEQEPRILTERHLPTSFITKIDDMHKEIVKNPVTEYFEAGGFDGIAAGVEKLYEGEGIVTALKYWGSNFAGVLAAAVLGVVGIYLAGRFSGIQRSLQQLLNWRQRDLPRAQRSILALDENGDARSQSRRDVEARERRVANGGTSLADLVGNDTNVAQTQALREQLALMNPELLKFNNRAPSFLQSFRKLPTEAKATQAANGVKKVAEAATGINHGQLLQVADGVNKINNAMRNADHRKIGKVAKAVGKLKDAMQGFDPKDLPKSSDLGPAATKMGELADATETLRTKFRELSGTIQSLDQALGATR
ncbi:hypothetical protein [Streptomyces roseicoloratus]|uniref:hypothetical protein n=1 Tax=Streptomyces roseicoloratus TaxID=2508722 RepID=UPI001009F73E|nr:hypothetical protein [Streptomyces roseicoloratus]